MFLTSNTAIAQKNKSQEGKTHPMESKKQTVQKADDTIVLPATAQKKPQIQIPYETVTGDPLGVRIYTLKNGLKLYLSVNNTEPRIYTNIPVRAGSKHDPKETTGLAHYLEHMMFKGTDKIGALNWAQEKVMLQKISDLYEKHRQETDLDKRKAIYKEIDQVSNEAAKLVAANEYDKIISALGARGTNAYTSVEQTVYLNDIPSNELERWMQVESERFKMVVLRLFHTELEAVYEEFNINQDRDFRKVSQAINETLFPTHQYGTQTTIGEGEHLKNPSHVKIQEYFNTYYKPNNMAIVLAGDFDPETVVALAEKYFGSYQNAVITKFTFKPQPELTQVIRKEVFGQEAPYVQAAWRFGGATSKDVDYLIMISRILSNGRAGLIDLNLLQKQKVLEARAMFSNMEDYSVFQLYGKPREGQTQEDVEKLLIAELEKIKRGEFDEWLLSAIIKDFKLSEMRASESNPARVSQMTNAFILGVKWEDQVKLFDRLATISKQDIVRFANDRFKDNYVVVYKKSGQDPGVLKVDKPAITPVTLNRAASSDFTSKFLKTEAPRLEPVFVDYKKEIQTNKLSKGVELDYIKNQSALFRSFKTSVMVVELDYIKNQSNPTFILDYIVEMGKKSDKELAFAISYLPYLGTDKYSPDQLKQEFFKLGLNFSVNVSDERAFIALSGLDESLEEGIKLLEHILSSVRGDAKALKNLVDDELLRRENDKKNKNVILRSAMANYARYGKESPFTNNLTESELNALTPEGMVAKIKGLSSYQHRIFYYGSKDKTAVTALLEKHHNVPSKLLPVLPPRPFAELATSNNKVLFVDFPMVQAEIMLISKGSEKFNLEEYIMAELYNTYFGSGLSSIVFQEIRESRALAYSANALYSSPSESNEAHYLRAYVGTQADKLPDAINAMRDIIENMPVSYEQISQAVQSIQKRIETGRVTKDNIYWSYLTTQRRGFDRDLRKDVYDKMKIVKPEDLSDFHSKYVKGRNYTYLVLGSKSKIDMDYLNRIGPVTELSLQEVFGLEKVVRP